MGVLEHYCLMLLLFFLDVIHVRDAGYGLTNYKWGEMSAEY